MGLASGARTCPQSGLCLWLPRRHGHPHLNFIPRVKLTEPVAIPQSTRASWSGVLKFERDITLQIGKHSTGGFALRTLPFNPEDCLSTLRSMLTLLQFTTLFE